MKYTNKIQLIKNSLFSSGNQIINSLIFLVTTPILIFYLNSEGYGIYVLLTSLVGFYNLFDLGLGQGIVKFISNYKVKKMYDKISCVFISTIIFQGILGIIGSLFIFIFSHNIINILNISSYYYHDSIMGLYLCSIGFLFSVINSTLNFTLEGAQRYDVSSKIDVIRNIFLNISLIIILFLGFGLFEAILINVLITIITTIILLRKIILIFPFIFKNFKYDKIELIKLIKFSSYLYITKSAVIFNNYIVRFIIGALLGPVSVTYYDVPFKFAKAVGGLINRAFGVLFPYFSELYALDDRDKIRIEFIYIYKYAVMLYTPIFISLIILSKFILTLWIGVDFANESYQVLILFLIYYFLSATTTIPANLSYGMNKPYFMVYSSFFVILCSLVLIYPLIRLFNLNGAIYTLMLTQIQVPVIIYYISNRLLNLNLISLFREVFVYPVLYFLIFLFFLIIFNNTFIYLISYHPILFVSLILLLYCFLAIYINFIEFLNIYKRLASNN